MHFLIKFHYNIIRQTSLRVLANYPLSQLLLTTTAMKRHIIKHLMFILVLLPIISSAQTQIPSDEAKKNFANCVNNENAWADCYHYLSTDEQDTTNSNNVDEQEPTDYIAPNWYGILFPSFTSADNTQGLSPWNPTPSELFLRDHYDVPNNPYYGYPF